MCLFPPLASLNIFSLSLIYYSFTLMCEGVGFLVFILLELTPLLSLSLLFHLRGWEIEPEQEGRIVADNPLLDIYQPLTGSIAPSCSLLPPPPLSRELQSYSRGFS